MRAKSLEVKLSSPGGKMQVVFGECTLDVGDMPSKEAALHPPQPAPAQAPAPEAAQSDLAAVSMGETSLAADAHASGSHGNGQPSQPPGTAKGEPRKSNRPQNGMAGKGSSPPPADDDEHGDGGRRAKTGTTAKA